MLNFSAVKKNLKKSHTGLKPIRIALLADSATQLLALAISGYGYEAGVYFELYEADYQQIDAQIFNPGSDLFKWEPEFVIVHLSTEHLLKSFYDAAPGERKRFAENQMDMVGRRYQAISGTSKAKLLLNTFIELDDGVFGSFATKEKSSFLFQLRRLNTLLMEYVQQEPAVFLFDLLSLQNKEGYQSFFDSKMYFQADMVFSMDFLVPVAKSITDVILAISGVFRKAIIVDLDNTMWGGIIGDDGMEGIEIGALGLGKVFTEFQQWLKELKKRGILIAICSKNTEEIAKEPFISHPDMVLRLEDIAVFVANWETKVQNIRFIQSVLNIGFDSMVFVDDNPFEREMVKSAIPEVFVPSLPEDPTEYLTFLRSLNLFETASYTEEDETRTHQYHVEQKRDSFQQKFSNEDEFLESLDMIAEVVPFSRFNIPRISQLTQRSNQFNLRTIRYSEDQLDLISHSPDYHTLSFTLADKFGHYGLISAVILQAAGENELFIDTWIMSCRVLKRGVENLVLNSIMELAAKNSFKKIIGEYIPTKKNALVKNHFQDLGFEFRSGRWELEVSGYATRANLIKAKNESGETFHKTEIK